MSVDELLEQLSQRGVQLWFEGSRLRFRAPRGAMAAEQREQLVERRDEVISALRAQALTESRFAPLSYGQRSLWFVNQDEPASAAYNVAFAVRLSSPVDGDAMRQALQAVVDRHAILRTTYEIVNDRPHQRIVGAATAAFDIDEAGEIDEDELQARVDANYRRPFDLERGPVLRATLFTRRPDDHVLLLTAHHIAVDGWSLLILLDEFSKLYIEATGGPAAGLQKPDVDYADYVSWQQDMLSGSDGERLAGFWHDTLAAPRSEIELPADRPRPARKSVAGATFDFEIGSELSARLGELAKAEGTTLFVVLLAAFKALLFRYTGTEDVVVGTPAFGRSKLEFTRILGHFVNPLPLRTEVTGDLQFRQLMVAVRRTLLSALDAQEYPLPLMVERLQPVRDPSRSPLFETMFVLQRFEHFRELSELLVATSSSAEAEFAGLTCRPYPLHQQEGQFDLGLGLVEQGDALTGAIKYNTDLFELATVQAITNHYRTLLMGIVADPGMSVGALPIMDADERQGLIDSAGQCGAAMAPASTLHERFEAQVVRTPNAVAATCEGVQLTYAELNERANRVAHRLRAFGVGPDVLVGLCIDRSLELVVGLLGIVKAGGAYLPIDLSYPADRVQFMLEDAQARVIVTERALEGKLPGDLAIRVFIDDDFSAEPVSNPVSGVTADDLIYVIYTSGSTGRPKGTMLTHRAVDRLFQSTHAWYEFGPGDVWTLFHSAAFDFSVWEFWGALIYGGRLVVVPYWVSRSPDAFLDLLHRESVTVLNQTPSAFRQLIQADIQTGLPRSTSLRWVIFGGEALELQSLRPWFDRHGDRRPMLVNMYGITETCVHVTHRAISLADLDARAGSVIGVPIPDLRLHVLDQTREPSPIGVPGEMYVGGPGLARGYLNRHDLTAERFVPDPFVAGERLYRTGDLARRLASGDIEYLGRIDQQVKIRGFRIELGEIEAALAKCEGVHQCVVVVREDSAGNKRLVAYIVAPGEHSDVVSRVRSRLGELLPDYMLPSSYRFLDTLPLTSNGKVDRRALPAPETLTTAGRPDLEALETEVEKTLAAIWCEVLEVREVGRADNFFELGGHSLLIVTVLERLRRLGFVVNVRTVFAHPTLAALAAALSQSDKAPANSASTAPAIPAGSTSILPHMLPLVALAQDEIDLIVASVPGGAANVQDVYPLVPWQEGILFHYLLLREGEIDTYLVRGVLSFNTRALLDRFVEALQLVIDRHDALRTAILSDTLSRPVQVVYRVAPLTVEQIRPSGEAILDPKDPRWLRLDLSRGPLLRGYVAKAPSGDEWQLALLLHHIVIDQVSLGILIAEVETILSGQADALAPPPSYRDFIAATAGVTDAQHDDYFRALLGDVDEPTLPFGLIDLRGEVSQIVESRRALSPELTRRVRDAASRLSTSPAILFHVAWALVVARCCGKDDVVFGTVLSGRSQGTAGVDRVMGMFINTLPFRLSMAGTSVADAVRTAFTQLSELTHHEQASLAQAQRSSKLPTGLPLFNALLNFRHTVASRDSVFDGESGGALHGVRIVMADVRTNYPINANVDDSTEGFAISMQAAASLEPDHLAAMLVEAVEGLTSALETNLRVPIQSIVATLSLPTQPITSEPVQQLLDRLRALDEPIAPQTHVTPLASVRRLAADDVAPVALPRTGPLPLSSFQERLWAISRLDPQNTAFNMATFWKNDTPLDIARLEAAIGNVLERHEVLRSVFPHDGAAPFVKVLPVEAVPLSLHDVRGRSDDEIKSAVQAALAAGTAQPFDLSAEPPTRVSIFQGSRVTITLLVLHRIAADAWSMSVLRDEITAAYRGELGPPPALQYVDYAQWQRLANESEAVASEFDWWATHLAGAPEVSTFPSDRAQAAGNAAHVLRFSWNPELSEGIRTLASRHGATVYMTLVAACAATLRLHTGQDDMVIGSPLGLRERTEFERTVGPFVNLLMLRLDLSDDPTFAELIRRARNAVLDAHDHRHVSFEKLIERLKPARSMDHAPLFQVAIVQDSDSHDDATDIRSGGAMHELTWFVRDTDAGIAGELECRADLYSPESVSRIASHLEAILAAAVADPSRKVTAGVLLTPQERHQVVEGFNDTAADGSAESFVKRFERQVENNPVRIAVTFDGASLTYKELNDRANQLSRHLRAHGVALAQRVGVCLPRSLELLVTLIAIQKTGAAYVPLDPGFPADRLTQMLADSGATALVTSGDAVESLTIADSVTVLDVASGAATIAELNKANLEDKGPTGADPAYVIYTSGSTGTPKGVVVSHGGLANLLDSMARVPGLAADDVLAAVTTISFDIAGLELYLPLIVGARIEIVSADTAADGPELLAHITACGATVLQATPITWRLLIEAGWQGHQQFRAFCGGEALPRDLADQLLSRVGELWNLYGPTETTIWSTAERVQKGSDISIGRPIANTQVYVVDQSGDPVPIGIPGEIWIGGAGVALGYHRRPELTADRFIADAFRPGHGARLYRTGDMGRWRADGRLDHLGRLDHQVKIRGFRIELGEIEAVLATHPAVRQAVVLAREAGPGLYRLVAYIVYRVGEDLTVSDLRRFLRRQLPEYMVPSVVVSIDSVPLTPNGKLDRAKLPDPFKNASPAEADFEPPAAGTEELMAAIWRDVLKVERVSANDNFFELGGHSLLSLRVVAAVEKQLGWRMDPRTLFFQTLRMIAAAAIVESPSRRA